MNSITNPTAVSHCAIDAPISDRFKSLLILKLGPTFVLKRSLGLPFASFAVRFDQQRNSLKLCLCVEVCIYSSCTPTEYTKETASHKTQHIFRLKYIHTAHRLTGTGATPRLKMCANQFSSIQSQSQRSDHHQRARPSSNSQ